MPLVVVVAAVFVVVVAAVLVVVVVVVVVAGALFEYFMKFRLLSKSKLIMTSNSIQIITLTHVYSFVI